MLQLRWSPRSSQKYDGLASMKATITVTARSRILKLHSLQLICYLFCLDCFHSSADLKNLPPYTHPRLEASPVFVNGPNPPQDPGGPTEIDHRNSKTNINSSYFCASLTIHLFSTSNHKWIQCWKLYPWTYRDLGHQTNEWECSVTSIDLKET